jgi:AcrR family transcriptional regulator
VTDVATAAGTDARGTPPTRKGARTRARLVEAAKRIFERDGFLDARIVDIAEAADIAPGTFYHYFDSKEEIFREVAELQEARLIAIPEHPLRAGESAMEEIRASTRLYLSRYRDEAALMRVIELVSRYDEYVSTARMATLQHFFEQAEQNIRSLQRTGAVDRRLDAHLAAAALGAMAARFAELWLVQGYGNYDFDDAVEQLSRLSANALGLEDDTPKASRPRRSKR